MTSPLDGQASVKAVSPDQVIYKKIDIVSLFWMERTDVNTLKAFNKNFESPCVLNYQEE